MPNLKKCQGGGNNFVCNFMCVMCEHLKDISVGYRDQDCHENIPARTDMGACHHAPMNQY
jgi:hypothetical protein